MEKFITKCINVFATIPVIFIAWVLISWVDIISDNLDSNPEHFDWNCFVIISNNIEDNK